MKLFLGGFFVFNKDIFCERVLELRREKTMSQKQLAEICGLSESAIGKIEQKRRAASIEVVYAISEHFKISANWLLGLSDKKELDLF